jgi:hypothetical protein
VCAPVGYQIKRSAESPAAICVSDGRGLQEPETGLQHVRASVEMKAKNADIRISQPELDRAQETRQVASVGEQLGGDEDDAVAFVEANMPAEPQSLAETFSPCSKRDFEHDGLAERLIRWHTNRIAVLVGVPPDPLKSISSRLAVVAQRRLRCSSWAP